MEREEPAASLIDTLGDEVGGIDRAAVEQLLVLERIVDLGIRHGAGVEPDVDEVALALHRLAAVGDERDLVHVGTVQIDFVVVLSRIFTGDKALRFVRIGFHEAGSDSLVYFLI